MEEKSKLRTLKMQRTKLLRRSILTIDEFVELQDKLNLIELEIKELEKEKK